ncbi:MAG: pilus assembly protein PilO [Legionellales bacterium]|nr:pilus assembly protein PilO [Legionellales bacterium]|tara:strand:+ start:16705 stop:17385 length:681 start_codon:yes stop_codon:yes gene_type:complete
MAVNFNELTLENIGVWPNSAKGLVIGLLCLLILAIGYWFDTRSQAHILATTKQEEVDLKAAYEVKFSQAANLEVYKQQVTEMKQIFGDMLNQLPERTEIPQLIEDISKLGVASGLEFKLIKPAPEIEKDFYSELPIEISVVGTYHQLAEFVSSIANLPRIVTLNDFSIKRLSDMPTARKNQEVSSDLLNMEITAKTYRYGSQDGNPKAMNANTVNPVNKVAQPSGQ